MSVVEINGVKVSDEPLGFGWGRLGAPVRWTLKAGLLDYHGRQLWIAKANMLIWDGAYYAKTFAIASAKAWLAEHPE